MKFLWARGMQLWQTCRNFIPEDRYSFAQIPKLIKFLFLKIFSNCFHGFVKCIIDNPAKKIQQNTEIDWLNIREIWKKLILSRNILKTILWAERMCFAQSCQLTSDKKLVLSCSISKKVKNSIFSRKFFSSRSSREHAGCSFADLPIFFS